MKCELKPRLKSQEVLLGSWVTIGHTDVADILEAEDGSLPLEEFFPDLHQGSAIRGLRLRDGLTQEQLARLLGIKRTNLSEMENGKRPIGKNMAKRLAQVLKTDYKVFL
jgi:DNA-binding XRE family transcriptional regulator